jgi:hypothetical protein
MAGLLSKGIKLSYKMDGDSTWNELTNLQEIPEIGNGAPEKIEVTVLSDEAKKYIAGLGDSGQELSFKFLYEKAQFSTLAALDGTQDWQVELPDGATASFSGVPSVKMGSAGTNAAVNYSLTIIVESLITFA